MVDLMSIIKAPLLSKETIDKLIDAYIEGGEYWQFVYRNKRDNDNTEVDEYYRDKLNSIIFNNLRSNILSGEYLGLSKEEFIEARENMLNSHIASKDFFRFMAIRGYLREVGELSKTEDIKDTTVVLNNYYFDKYFKDIFSRDEISFILGRIIKEDNDYRIIESREEYGSSKNHDNLDEINHVLYLNLANCDIHRCSTIFLNKCRERNIPYSIKIAKDTSRDDSFVILSDDKNLDNYLSIINKIKKENPNMVERSYNPPILSGKIDEWIGYGEVPSKKEDSYTSKRFFPIIYAIKKSYNEWLKKNRDEKIIVSTVKNNGNMLLTPLEYISIRAIDCFYRDKYNYLGINIDSLEDQKVLNEYIDITEKLYQGQIINEPNNSDPIVGYCENELRQFIKKIPKLDDSFIPELLINIQEALSQEGISSKNICFNEENNLEKDLKEEPKSEKFDFVKTKFRKIFKNKRNY